MLDRVLPYLKASVEDDGPALELSADDSPVLVPYVGRLLVSYVVDEGHVLRLVTEGELRADGASLERVHAAALANFAQRIEGTGVRLAAIGNALAVLYDGNFEATLLLWEDLWQHVHERLGRDILAVAPARDILAIAAPEHVEELRAVVARVWPTGDHLLAPTILRRIGEAWRVHEAD